MNARFWRVSGRLSKGGEEWVFCASLGLQEQIEKRRALDPEGFSRIEQIRNPFEAAMHEDHVRIYTRLFSKLALIDLLRIPFVPYARCFIEIEGLWTAAKVLAGTIPQALKHPRGLIRLFRRRQQIHARYCPPKKLASYADSPLYWHLRLNDCIEGGRLHYPMFYELAAAVSYGHMTVYSQLSNAARECIVEVQRRLIEDIEERIDKDPEAAGRFEMGRSFDRAMMMRKQKAQQEAGAFDLPWEDVRLLSGATRNAVAPEVLASMGRLGIGEMLSVDGTLVRSLWNRLTRNGSPCG
jgi:hypothetical protein